MRGEARAPSGGGRKTRAATQIRRHGGFWYAVIFPTSINAAVRRKCSLSMLASQIAPKAAASPPLPRYGEAVTRRVRLYSAPIKSYTKNRVYSLRIWAI